MARKHEAFPAIDTRSAAVDHGHRLLIQPVAMIAAAAEIEILSMPMSRLDRKPLTRPAFRREHSAATDAFGFRR